MGKDNSDFQKFQEMYDLVVKPSISQVISSINELKKVVTAQNDTLNRHEAHIASNRTDIKNIKDSFKTYIALASLTLAAATFFMNLLMRATGN